MRRVAGQIMKLVHFNSGLAKQSIKLDDILPDLNDACAYHVELCWQIYQINLIVQMVKSDDSSLPLCAICKVEEQVLISSEGVNYCKAP